MVTGYLYGTDALADARMRLPALSPERGIIFVEGRNDLRLLAPFALGLDTVIPCGNKGKLLQAYGRQQPHEVQRFLFLADCDYDVPAGILRPSPNLVITERVDVEADLLALGMVERLVLELLPSAAESALLLRQTADLVEHRASVVAEGIGRFRQVSAVEGLGLSFDRIKPKKYRSIGQADVHMVKLARALLQTNPGCPLRVDDLVHKAQAVQGGFDLCQGKDLVSSIRAVVHDDFKVKVPAEDELLRLVRVMTNRDVLAQWAVIRRIKRWEETHRCRVLA